MTMKDLLAKEYSKVWNDQKMVNYCMKKVSDVAVMADGSLVVIEKPHIKTNFCFGESGYDIEDAEKAAHYAKTNEQYFVDENMRYTHFDREMAYLTHYINGGTGQTPYIYSAYWNTGDNCKLHNVRFYAYYETSPSDGDVLSVDDAKVLLETYKSAKAKFEKRLRTYLKRYGLSKVHSWTYWRDA